MSDNRSLFDIGTTEVDTEALLSSIRTAIEQKKAKGAYSDPRLAKPERIDLRQFQNHEAFLECYLQSLREAVFVDINDFEITERRRVAGSLLVSLKRILWKCLKFYTYRLWSQQNEINGLLLSAIEATDERYRARIKELEDRLAMAESRKPRE